MPDLCKSQVKNYLMENINPPEMNFSIEKWEQYTNEWNC